MRRIEINECGRRVINEDAIAGTGVTVTQDVVSIPLRTIQRGVVKLAQKSSGCRQLCVREMAKFRRYNARDERQDFSTRIIDPQEPRSAVEFTSFQMMQELMHERPTPIDRTTDRVADADNTRRRSSSCQRDFTFHSARSNDRGSPVN